MRPINVTLDSQTWELAKQKDNFSEWVRKQLRLEDEGLSISILKEERDQARKAIGMYLALQDVKE